MAKRNVWLCAAALAVLLAAVAVSADEPIQSKIFVGRPILKTKEVDEKAFETLNNKKDEEQPMIKIEPAAKVVEEEKLPPILPFFNSMSPFMKSIISSVGGGSGDAAAAAPPAAVDGAEEMPDRPRGVLTIVFMKAMKPSSDDSSSNDEGTPKDPASSLLEARSNFNLILSRILPQRLAQIFGGPTDPDSRPMRLIGGDDVDRNFAQSQQHLLGGDHDIDRFQPFLEDSSDADDDSSPFNQGAGPQIIIRTDNQPAGGGGDDDDMVRNYPPTNRCVMSFMRLKASAYYRTVVHLLFFSGIILLVLFMIILTIRVYRRRRALRFYNQNMHVATISYEDVPRKTGGANGGNLFLFRLGNLRNSYAQKQQAAADHTAEYKSSLLIQSPPAYEQVIAPSNTKLGKPQEEDAKSLPAYDEALLVADKKATNSSDV